MADKLDDFERRLTLSENATRSLKDSVELVNDQFDKISAACLKNSSSIDVLKSDIQNVTEENASLHDACSALNDLNKSLKADLVYLKCRSMRDNLVFTNIPEINQYRDGRRFEDTENELNKFLENQLQIRDVKFERVHMINPARNKTSTRSQPRPINAKFTSFL
ncbi:hypothetical protein ACF0H5_006575 [Mactra antiquata]